MNYYERHLGDYAKDAGHLDMLEHGAYSMLMDRYYATEAGIPEADVFRVTRAKSASEKTATKRVLAEFFVLTDGVWIKGRIEREIAKYQDKQAKAKRSAEARWNKSEGNANAYADDMRTHCEGNAPQSPDTKHQTQSSSIPTPEVHSGTEAGRACLLMRQAGCGHTNSSNPDLLAALAEGITPETLADYTRAAIDRGKRSPFGYAITAARNDRAQGVTHANSSPGRKLSVVERVAGNIAAIEQRDASVLEARLLDAG